jgi:hypothetical protein
MPYANLSDTTWSDPALGTLSDQAFRLHINAYSYCSNHLTDGRLTARQVEQVGFMFGLVGDALKAAATELVQAGVWTEALTEYTLPSFIATNWSRARIEEQRAGTAARVRKHRRKRKPNA